MGIGIREYNLIPGIYTGATAKPTQNSVRQSVDAPAQGDTVCISSAYRSARRIAGAHGGANETLRYPGTRENAFTFGPLRFSNRAWAGTQTAAEAASGFKYHTEPGRVESEMSAARQAETSALGKKIGQALKKAGIELSQDDKLAFKVAKDGTISVDSSGLTEKTRAKVRDIEAALNKETGLGKQLVLNSAATALHEADMRRSGNLATIVTEYQIGDNDPYVAAAHKETLDDYLRTNLGFGIDELAADGFGQESTENYGAKANAFMDFAYENMSFDEFGQIQAHVGSAIANASKDGAVGFEASYTYQNGVLVDDKARHSAETPARTEGKSGATADSATAGGETPESIAESITSSWAALHAANQASDAVMSELMDANASSKDMNEALEKVIEESMKNAKESGPDINT